MISMLVLFLLSMIHCFFSIDWDEEYTVLIAAQIADGYHMFGEIWASHQTSAMFLAPWVFLWKLLFGTECLMLGLRIFSVFFVAAVTVIMYSLIRNVVDKKAAAMISIVLFLLLPRGTISLEYGLFSMCFVSLSVAFMLSGTNRERHTLEIICSAVFWSMAVLVYPFYALLTPFLFWGICLFYKKDRWKLIIVFIISCLVCAVLFFLFVFSGTSLEAFTEGLNIIIHDPHHSSSFLSRMTVSSVTDVAKKLMILITGTVIIFGMILGISSRMKKSISRNDVLYLLAISSFVCYGVLMLIGNITKIYVTGCMGISVGFLLFFIFTALISVHNHADREIWVCLFGFFLYFCAFMQGNLTFKDYLNYLYLPLFLLIYQILYYQSSSFGNMPKIKSLAFTVFILSLIYTKCFSVRIDGVGHSTIFEERKTVSNGIMKGIAVFPDISEEFERKGSYLSENTKSDQNYLLMDDRLLLNEEIKGNYIFVCAIDGDVLSACEDERWIEYMESDFHSAPDVVYVDKKPFQNVQEFFVTKLGEYLSGAYKNDDETDYFYILTRVSKK